MPESGRALLVGRASALQRLLDTGWGAADGWSRVSVAVIPDRAPLLSHFAALAPTGGGVLEADRDACARQAHAAARELAHRCAATVCCDHRVVRGWGAVGRLVRSGAFDDVTVVGASPLALMLAGDLPGRRRAARGRRQGAPAVLGERRRPARLAHAGGPGQRDVDARLGLGQRADLE